MTRLVDTSIRVLSQEPLAGAIPTATLLELAEVLDGAGFAYLEVSGGGVFDSAVRQGVESPWERIRSLKALMATLEGSCGPRSPCAAVSWSARARWATT